MAKKNTSPTDNPGETPPPKRQRVQSQSYLSRLFPYLGRITAWAEEQYKAGRFDQAVSDEELDARDKLRKVLADFPVPKA